MSELTKDGLEGVNHIVAVASCKGGVGKSTVAMNLAFALKEKGAKVGLFDADIYGPSLPTLIRLASEELVIQDKRITPLEYEGVKLMSFGYSQTTTNQKGPAILRGPLVSQLIQQLLTGTHWGELDYLVLDLPPGTGDIQLTLMQLLSMSAAVIVTTPQLLSFVDVVKGIQMFDRLSVPIVSVVENMSYFVCDHCTTQHDIFGSGASERLAAQFGFKHIHKIPLLPSIGDAVDQGVPTMIADPTGEAAGIFRAIADTVIAQIEHIVTSGSDTLPNVRYEEADYQIIVTEAHSDRTHLIDPRQLRLKCRCAECVNELTGASNIRPELIPRRVRPLEINAVGNYAIGVNWSDGHSSLVPFEYLLHFHQLAQV